RPFSPRPNPSRNGTALVAHSVGSGYAEAEAPKQDCNISVLMMPGFSGIAARPAGSSWAKACVNPSIPHLVAQYGATSASVDRPQPELKLTITPSPRSIMAGTKWRMRFATPFKFTSITSENSAAEIFHKGAFWFITPALFNSRSGGPC